MILQILFYALCGALVITAIVVFTTKGWPEEQTRK